MHFYTCITFHQFIFFNLFKLFITVLTELVVYSLAKIEL